MRIGIVAGEPSGDLLGEGLMQALKERAPAARFEGIGGPRMIAQGCRSLYPMERLSVMGLVEVLGRLRELYALRARLARHFIDQPPAVFVGIDAPDFNLGLESRLRAAGIRTAHYVSPTVWAWRRGRLRTIARATDRMLALFPFEAAFYHEHGIPVEFVGHPLADAIPLETDARAARAALGLPATAEIVALLPGSREGEVSRLADAFIGAARWCAERRPGLRFAVPLVNAATRGLVEQALARAGQTPSIALFDGRSREVMAAADVVLLASGTAALEAMLLKRPYVAAYRVQPLTYWLMRHLIYIEHYTMPNLLAGERLAPEFIQQGVTPETLGAAVLDYLEHPAKAQALRERFAALHQELRRDASARAAEAVLELARVRG